MVVEEYLGLDVSTTYFGSFTEISVVKGEAISLLEFNVSPDDKLKCLQLTVTDGLTSDQENRTFDLLQHPSTNLPTPFADELVWSNSFLQNVILTSSTITTQGINGGAPSPGDKVYFDITSSSGPVKGKFTLFLLGNENEVVTDFSTINDETNPEVWPKLLFSDCPSPS